MSHARSRALTYRTQLWSLKELDLPILRYNHWLFIILMITTLLSGFTEVYVQTQNRMMFAETQQLQKHADYLRVRWAELLLEQSTWASQPRIQNIAEKDLQMRLPSKRQLIVSSH